MGFLAHIRSKDKQVKAQYSLAGAILFTLITAGIWVSTLPSRFADGDAVQLKEGSMGAPERSLGELVDDAKTQLGNVIDAKGEPSKSENAPPSDRLNALGSESFTLSTTSESVSDDATLTASTSDTTTPPAPSASLPAESATGTNEYQVSNTPPEPRVILIGTTTSKKAE